MATSTFGTKPAAAPSAGSTLGPGITVEGEISGTDPLVVQGTVKGQVRVQNAVTVDAGAVVEADVEATELRVLGALAGNCVASERLEVAAAGRLIGNVRAPRIAIAEGAAFKGQIDMDVP